LPRKLGIRDIQDIATGAAVLGTGGGGDPHIGMLMAIQAIEEYGPIELISPEELPDDALIVPSAMMGAPTVIVEKIPSGEESLVAFEALQSYLGREVYATIPIEAGGLNSMIPLALAARTGLPVVDADGMGRAFPELQMVTYHLGGLKATPMVLTDEKGNSLVLNTIDNFWTERLARSATVDMGGASLIAIYPMSGKECKEHGIAGIVTLAGQIGAAIREARGSHDSAIDRVLEITGGFRLFEGKIVDVSRRTEGGFARGEATLAGMGSDQGETLRISFQNENLVARTERGEVLACVPDLITVLDAETGKPVTTEALKYGYRVVVIGIPCSEKWRTPEGLEVVGPRYFGYDIDWVPVEELARDREGRSR